MPQKWFTLYSNETHTAIGMIRDYVECLDMYSIDEIQELLNTDAIPIELYKAMRGYFVDRARREESEE